MNRPDVISGFKQVSGKRMTECMAGGVFDDTGGAHGFSHRFLQARRVYVMTTREARTRIGGKGFGREDVLPCPFLVGVGIFAFQREREIDRAAAFFQIILMQLFDPKQMGL